MQIIVPLAGPSPFFKAEDYPFPKPLIEVAGRPMIELVVENLRGLADDPRFIFVIRQDDAARFSLARTLDIITEGKATVVTLREQAQGSLCSCLMAIDDIRPDEPLVVANGDQVIGTDLKRLVASFEAAEADAGVATFDSVHPRWSYIRADGAGLVLEAAEKRVISRHAVAGLYYFRKGQTFIDAAMRTIEADASHNGAFFVAPALNEVILQGGKVVHTPLPAGAYHSFYSPPKLLEFEESRILRSLGGLSPRGEERVQVMIPAAGEGSRFAKVGFEKPKPFIDVDGRPMIERVIENVSPRNAHVQILLRREHVERCATEAEALRRAGLGITLVDKLTEGTACTLLLARKTFDNSAPMMVANSDQWVDFSVDAFVDDCIARNLDGSILVFRDAERNPKWSFAKIDAAGLVVEVAEKKPISDLATVGIYLFRRGDQFVSAAIDMIALNDRVNNEFYTCPVYNYMIRNGARIGVFEVSPDAMHGLGTPEDLALYLAKDRPAR